MTKQVLSLAFMLLAASCDKYSDTPSTGNEPVAAGSYMITLFTDNSDGNITADYNDFSFEFTDDNRLIATSETATITGTWSQRAAHENEAAKLDLSFNDGPLKKLDKSWEIVSITASKISLRDDDTQSNEVLVFEKR